jgi:REP element-mobilizing transposase RayT
MACLRPEFPLPSKQKVFSLEGNRLKWVRVPIPNQLLREAHRYSRSSRRVAYRQLQGVFTRNAAEEVCECWEGHMPDWRIRLRKVTVLPDHVHIAMCSHPTVAPGRVALELMATSQQLMRERFEPLVVQTGIPRLWKPGAYLGSYGDIAKEHVRNYLRRWADKAK